MKRETPASKIHTAASTGFSRAADEYERGRPEYPEEVIRFLAERLFEFRADSVRGTDKPLDVVDLAAGTGKFTRVLEVIREGDPEAIDAIIAVEPVAEMRAKCSEMIERFGSGRPSMVMEGTAENIPIAESSIDVLTVAQAFHWFDGEKALPEIHRVLKPGGMLLLIWNVRDESVEWIRAMTALMKPYEGDAPRYLSMKWREAFRNSELFTPLELTKFKNPTLGTMETMLDRVASVSFVASLESAARAELLSRMRDLYSSRLGVDGAPAGLLKMPYETNIFICRAIPSPR